MKYEKSTQQWYNNNSAYNKLYYTHCINVSSTWGRNVRGILSARNNANIHTRLTHMTEVVYGGWGRIRRNGRLGPRQCRTCLVVREFRSSCKSFLRVRKRAISSNNIEQLLLLTHDARRAYLSYNEICDISSPGYAFRFFPTPLPPHPKTLIKY